ncbi:penicillin-binding protein activator LpoB [Brenneria uluponensis]|uniref:penicillin-binding protein activator LpoB n=1 Tax=Brenneria uluponensis TaxID=3057057 RepID=UPI0028E992DE|nr:penicillin-binding protein activator LpoB [Brenneria ulupoensis]
MKKYLGLLLLALVLAGCSNRPPESGQPPASIEPVQPEKPTLPPQSEPLPVPPKLQTFDWDASITPLIDQMLKTSGINKGSILLVDNMKNNTNGALQTVNATTSIYHALAANTVFTVVSREQLAVARQTLGISAEDSLGSRTKAIGLARYIGAQYALYSDVSGDVNSPNLDMQLMLVRTGEIVWSGSGTVRQ